MTTRTDPYVSLLGVLWRTGWEISQIGWAWVSQCPACGTDLSAGSLDQMVDLCWDHLAHAHPGD